MCSSLHLPIHTTTWPSSLVKPGDPGLAALREGSQFQNAHSCSISVKTWQPPSWRSTLAELPT